MPHPYNLRLRSQIAPPARASVFCGRSGCVLQKTQLAMLRAAKNTACYVLANIRFPHRWGKALSGKADDDLTESLRPRQRIHAAKVGSIAGCRIGTRPATLCHRGATLPAERFRQKSAPPLQCWDSQPDNQTDNQTYRQPGGYRTGQPVKRLMEQTTIQPYKPPKHQPFHPAIIQMSNGLSE